MGASGCGKTTLMSTLANRKPKKVITEGDVVINGYPIGNFMHYLSGFMHQEDLFISSLTVAEHLNIMAQLKLDRRITKSERKAKIRNLIQQLGLINCLDCKIGGISDHDKTLSGGERKRLSLATELLTDPKLLFCDEPTTGLDSFSANKIISLMNIMAAQGKTIICTIHQPSSEIFSLFSQLILMTNGRIAFQGSRTNALDFFQTLGYHCPDAYNPADFFIKILSVKDVNLSSDRQKNKKICDYFAVSEYSQDIENIIQLQFEFSHSIKNRNLNKYRNFKDIFVWTKFNLLMYRNLLQVVRDPTIQLFRIGQKIAIAIMVGLCYFQTNIFTQHGIQSVQGLIFIFVVENTFSPMYSVLSLFPQEFPLFIREYRSGLYSSQIYYLSKILALLPGLIIEPMLFVIIGYWLAGLRQTKEAIFYTILIAIFTMNISTACGCLFSNLFGSVPTALAFLVPFDYVLFMTSGTFIKISSLSTLFGWVKYLSWLLYATESMSILQWKQIDIINGEPIKLPENLESLPKAELFPKQRHRWNTNEEIAAILINFEHHSEWQSKEVKIRPKSGSMLLYSRKKVRYRRDGYCWKKRKDGKTTREDHMKLKVQGTECIYGCYVHSAILPTFHRRCYWLLQNPDIVLVHYLNVPYPDDNKISIIAPNSALWSDKKEWTKDELISQLKPMFFNEDEPDASNDLGIANSETIEALVNQMMEKQTSIRQNSIIKHLECGCPDSTYFDRKSCSHHIRKPILKAKNNSECSPNGNPTSSSHVLSPRSIENQVSSTTEFSNSSRSGRRTSSGLHRSTSHRHNFNNQSQSQQSPSTDRNNTSSSSLIFSLSQIQSNNSLLILNNSSPSNQNTSNRQQHMSPISYVCHNTNGTNRDKNCFKSTKCENNEILIKEKTGDCKNKESHLTNHIEGNHNRNNVNTNNNINNNNNQNVPKSLNQCNEIINFHKVPLNHTEMFTTNNSNSNGNINNNNNEIVLIESTKSNIHIQNNTNVDGNHFLTNTIVLLDTNQKNSMFNETLELSQDDIQKTLLANLPVSCSSVNHQFQNSNNNNNDNNNNRTEMGLSPQKSRTILNQKSQHKVVQTIEMNSIEFMEQCDDDVMEHSAHVVDDDVFVNLDAFDILGEFPDLEVLDNESSNSLLQIRDHHSLISHNTNTVGTVGAAATAAVIQLNQKGPFNHNSLPATEGSVEITDYSPEWAYPEGGVKVLVTGPWYSSSTYTIFFDTFPVPTTLVQSGVLRCYCPAHEAGLATLQVACDGFMISNSVIFEYKHPPQELNLKLGEKVIDTANDSLLKFTLMQRLEAIDQSLQIKQEPESSDAIDDSMNFMQKEFEDNLIDYCQKIWHRNRHCEIDDNIHRKWLGNYKSMTLLHLAVALDYSKLVNVLLQWSSQNTSPILKREINAFSQDDDGYTPLMWACYRGHIQMAINLVKWNNQALSITNKYSQNALDIAKDNQHFNLVRQIRFLIYNESISDDLMLYDSNCNNRHSPISSDLFNYHLVRRSSVDSGINMNSDYNNYNIQSLSSPASPESSM